MQDGEIINSEQKVIYVNLKQKLVQTNSSALIIRGIIKDYGNIIQDVFKKIKSVQGIANKTNLLAINASIETIHASDLLASFEEIVSSNLFIQAKILAQILEYDPDFLCQDGVKLAKECGMEEFFITDGDGIVRFTNLPAWNNAHLSSSDILRILKDPELEIALPATGNGMESEQYKVVGIARKDQSGLIQISSHFVRPKGQLAIDGFGVVAKEAKRLADVSKEISAKITSLTNEMGEKIRKLEKSSEDLNNCINEYIELLGETIGQNKQLESKIEWADVLKDKASTLDDSLREIKAFFKSILSPLKELINIARQTNLLGVRAAIEAAHSTNDKQDFDNLLNEHMTIEAKLCSFLIERRPDMTCEDMVTLSEYTGIGEFWITDESGMVELTNVPGGKGYVFQNEGQTAPYMRILADPDLVVTAPPALRALDNKVFKYVGVGRKGKTGLFQMGNPSKLYGESTAEGFSVVSKQIKNLAEQSKEITKEIEALVEGMDFKAQKAIDQMKTLQKSRMETSGILEGLK